MAHQGRDQRLKFLKQLSAKLGEFGKPSRERNFAQLHETMNNLALVSGGVATGALVLLSSNVQLNMPLALSGIVIQFINLGFYFVYKISAHVEAQDLMRDIDERIITPLNELLELGEDKGISDDDFNSKADIQLGAIKTYTNDWKPSSLKTRWIKRPEAVCYWLFVAGLVLVGLGLLMPYMQQNHGWELFKWVISFIAGGGAFAFAKWLLDKIPS